MFSALRQGSVLYILEKGENPTLKIGNVIGITQPNYNNFLINGSTVDINVKANDETMEFRNVPGTQSITTYNNAIIAETKELISNEVDNMLQNSKNIVDSVPYHNNVITSCEGILKNLNPRFAKEKERDEDISNLKTKIGGIESKMDKIITLLSKEELK